MILYLANIINFLFGKPRVAEVQMIFMRLTVQKEIIEWLFLLESSPPTYHGSSLPSKVMNLPDAFSFVAL
jgi:hypothetical protein